MPVVLASGEPFFEAGLQLEMGRTPYRSERRGHRWYSRGMVLRALALRSTLAAFAGLLVGACSSAAPAADAPAAGTTPRVFVEAMVFDVPADGLRTIGSKDVASFGDLAAQAGARYVVSPHFLIPDDVVTRMSRPTTFAKTSSAIDAAFASYRLDVKPHVMEPGRVRLDMDFDLADRQMKTTVEVDDKQVLFVGTDVVVEDRRFVLVVRPNIVRSDADLEALFAERSARRETEMGAGNGNTGNPPP